MRRRPEWTLRATIGRGFPVVPELQRRQEPQLLRRCEERWSSGYVEFASHDASSEGSDAVTCAIPGETGQRGDASPEGGCAGPGASRGQPGGRKAEGEGDSAFLHGVHRVTVYFGARIRRWDRPFEHHFQLRFMVCQPRVPNSRCGVPEREDKVDAHDGPVRFHERDLDMPGRAASFKDCPAACTGEYDCSGADAVAAACADLRDRRESHAAGIITRGRGHGALCGGEDGEDE